MCVTHVCEDTEGSLEEYCTYNNLQSTSLGAYCALWLLSAALRSPARSNPPPLLESFICGKNINHLSCVV